MGEAPTPPWVYADVAASDARRAAKLTGNQIDLLLKILVAKKVLTVHEHRAIRNVPR
jgi:hypothetical protein